MSVIPMKALLESGVHFGHRTQKWHPAMKPYIFTERNGIHIIDLQKTVKAVEQAYTLVSETVSTGGNVLFVGTKRQAQETIQAEATRAGMPYVTERWLGGMLTNWRTIRARINELDRLERMRDTVSEGGNVLFVGTKRQAQETIQLEATRAGMPYVIERWLGGMLTNWRTIRARINELDRLERMRDTGDFGRITKKEALILSREIERLEVLLGGIRTMVRVPELLFVVDVQREATAIHEANLLKIPVIGMVDTNCDPSNVDYVIPSNDDAIRAIKLMVGKIADAAVEGKAMRKEEAEEEPLRMAVQALPEELELTDEELLGESTLAKITPKVEFTAEEFAADSDLEAVKEEVDEDLEEIEAEEVDWQVFTSEDEDQEEE